MAHRPCLTCRRPFVGTGARCARCQVRTPNRTYAERRRREAVVQAHRELLGDWCPGWNRPAHRADETNPLTADHVHAVAAGGREDGPLQVLCRRCNSSKKDN